MKKMARWNFRRDRMLARTATAPGRVLRKRKSFRDCQIQNLDKFRRYTKIRGGGYQLIRVEAEENVTDQEDRTHKGRTEHERLEPGKNTMRERTVEKQMFQGLQWSTTEAGEGD